MTHTPDTMEKARELVRQIRQRDKSGDYELSYYSCEHIIASAMYGNIVLNEDDKKVVHAALSYFADMGKNIVTVEQHKYVSAIANNAGLAFERIAAALAEARAVPDGWKLVPMELTDDMRCAGWDTAFYDGESTEIDNLDECYRAMLAAAPNPPIAGGGL